MILFHNLSAGLRMTGAAIGRIGIHVDETVNPGLNADRKTPDVVGHLPFLKSWVKFGIANRGYNQTSRSSLKTAKFAGGHSHGCAKGPRESAVVIETAFLGNVGHGTIGFAQET